VVSRRYRDKNTVGTRLNNLSNKIESAEKKSGLSQTKVESGNLDTNSVVRDAIAPGAVGPNEIDRGAVGTENLGVVNAITTDSDLSLLGPTYVAPPAGAYMPLALDENNSVVLDPNGGFTVRGVVTTPYYTSGPAEVTLSNSTIITATHIYSEARIVTGDQVLVVRDGASWSIIAKINTTAEYPSWYSLPLSNSWVDFGSVYGFSGLNTPSAGVKFTRTASGIVLVKGLVKSGTITAGSIIGTLPIGFRPTKDQWFQSMQAGNLGRNLKVKQNGEIVTGPNSGDSSYVSLSDIWFHADNTQTYTALTSPLNGWNLTSDSTLQVPGYFLDTDGIAFVRGAMGTIGTTTNTTLLFSMPSGLNSIQARHMMSANSTANASFSYIDQTNGYLYGQIAGTTPTNFHWRAIYDVASGGPLFTPGSYTNSWQRYSSLFPDAAFYKRADGLVVLKGFISTGALGTSAFTLPKGYRPAQNLIMSRIANSGAGRLDIGADGTVTPVTGSNVWFSLEGVTFVAEQ
jgi:hypothetical protein